MVNLQKLLSSKLINKTEIAERLFPDVNRTNAQKKFNMKLNNKYMGQGFTEEEQKRISDIWLDFVRSVQE